MNMVTSQHQEWLALIDASGPFLALPVLLQTFPQGLDRVDSYVKRDLRLAYKEWVISQDNPRDSEKYHAPWIRYVLKNLLGYPAELLLDADDAATFSVELSEHGETLRPDIVLVFPNSAQEPTKPRLLISIYPPEQHLEQAISQKHSKWTASPATRMMELLRRLKLGVGIVTNGEQWMLVHAPQAETASFISWYASIWLEEECTLRAFVALLSAYRLFGVPSEQTTEALFAKSSEFQYEVTTQLGQQVRKAIEQLIQALDSIDKDSGRAILRQVSETLLYEAGVTVMMRLVFLLTAEERNLFPINNQIYSENYAISTLREQLAQSAARHGEEVLERRYDAWNRLITTFRIIFAGVRHEDFNMPAYGGTLFDPDRYPFLEGRQAGTTWYEENVVPLSVNNRTVLHLLESLQILQGKGSKEEARKLSFLALDVEQIGHVYESLLEHTAVRADDLVLGLEGAQGKEPELPISKLEYARQSGNDDLIRWLQQQTGKTESALSNLLKKTDRFPEYKVRAVCDNDERLYQAARPFVGLVREDRQSMPVIFTPGSIYVTESSDRRSSGTHYTPRALTEPIVQHTLDPLLYAGMADGVPPSIHTLRSSTEILELKICDMTCGSGAFLVQACRYLADKLVEAWSKSASGLPPETIMDINGQKVTLDCDPRRIVPVDDKDRVMLARRLIVDRCLYGVDCNPMAIEMAKLSLWLVTLQRNKPFSFIDHAIKVGDSLIGISNARQLQYFDFNPEEGKTQRRISQYTSELVDEARTARVKLERLPIADICDCQIKEKLHKQAEEKTHQSKLIADLLVQVLLSSAKNPTAQATVLDRLSLDLALMLSTGSTGDSQDISTLRAKYQLDASAKLLDRNPFHWNLDFPEIFSTEQAGFDAVMGNPPFTGGRRLLGSLGANYRDFLANVLYPGTTTNADLVAFFFRRAFEITRKGGCIGLLATKSIAESYTSEVSLDAILKSGGEIYRAKTGIPWPGSAGVRVSLVCITKRVKTSPIVLNDQKVDYIDRYLTAHAHLPNEPHKLKKRIVYSQGISLQGDGFIITSEEAAKLLEIDRKNEQVLRPYMNGDALNNLPDQIPQSFAIHFANRELEEASSFIEPFRIVTERVKDYRDSLTGQIHEQRYWLFWDKREKFFAQVESMERILASAIVTKHLSFSFVPPTWVYSHALKLFSIDDYAHFAVLQSSMHEIWARRYSSYLEARLRYSTSRAFDTFAWPVDVSPVEEHGQRYYQARKNILLENRHGLTTLYNNFHDPGVQDKDIERLRELHIQMDQAVIAQYGWDPKLMNHDFRESPDGIRFAISDSSKQSLLGLLLDLNQQQALIETSTKDRSSKNKKGKKSILGTALRGGTFDNGA